MAKGKRKGHIAKGRKKAYNDLREQGMSKSHAAAIANAGRTFAGRSKMAKKAARTRKIHIK